MLSIFETAIRNDLVANCEMDYCAEAIKIPLSLIIEVDYMLTGIDASENSMFISVFSNPCNSELKVTIPKLIMSENPSLTLSDIFSQTVLNNPKLGSSKTILDVSNLSTGIYVLNIFTIERKETVLISIK